MTTISITAPDTNPDGVALPQPADLPAALAPQWRPEDDVTDQLYALADRLDAADPLFVDIADVAATSLIMAGKQFDILAARRGRRYVCATDAAGRISVTELDIAAPLRRREMGGAR